MYQYRGQSSTRIWAQTKVQLEPLGRNGSWTHPELRYCTFLHDLSFWLRSNKLHDKLKQQFREKFWPNCKYALSLKLLLWLAAYSHRGNKWQWNQLSDQLVKQRACRWPAQKGKNSLYLGWRNCTKGRIRGEWGILQESLWPRRWHDYHRLPWNCT